MTPCGIARHKFTINPGNTQQYYDGKELLSIADKRVPHDPIRVQELLLHHTDHKISRMQISTHYSMTTAPEKEQSQPSLPIRGDNTQADALSRLPHVEGQTAEDNGISSYTSEYQLQIDASDTEQESERHVYSALNAQENETESTHDILLSFPEPQGVFQHGESSSPVDFKRLAKEKAKTNKCSSQNPTAVKTARLWA
jgi:hypothetical protein